MKHILLGALLLCMETSAQTFFFDFSAPQPVYSDAVGYGFDVTGVPLQFRTDAASVKLAKKGRVEPFFFSVKVPDGNYKVTVEVGDAKRPATTTLRAECRRLMAENIDTKKGETRIVEFVVNKRDSLIRKNNVDKKGEVVKLKPNERDYMTWDDRLTLEITGDAPAVKSIRIERDDNVPTLFLCGNSTVVDQDKEPWASWGQMLPRWFDANLAVANYAHSGLAVSSFISQRRFEKLLTQLRAGDYVIVEFGHNDQKEKAPGSGAWYNFSQGLKRMIDEVRTKGAMIIFSTPTQRRAWEADNKTIKETHGDYPAAMAAVAERENVPLIDLHQMTREFFQTLGFEGSKKALVHYPANTFPDQPQALADNTHFNTYGAYEVAKMVVMGLKQLATDSNTAKSFRAISALRSDFNDFDPNHPDNPDEFRWTPCVLTTTVKPDGN